MRVVDGIYMGICDVCDGEYKNGPGVRMQQARAVWRCVLL